MIRLFTSLANQVFGRPRIRPSSQIRIGIFLLTVGLTSCVRSQTAGKEFGINPMRTGFVPARIALAPCIAWPDRSTKILGLPFINRPANETAELCQELSKYMAEGFDNQPFMKGISQKLTEKLFGANSQILSLADSIGQEWVSQSKDCQTCGTLPSFYNSSIKPRPTWQIWLNNFAATTKGSDAILIPMVLSLNTRDGDDRGILESIRSGAVAMLLIDTNDGSLIWSGGREAEVINKALANTTTRTQMKSPPALDLQRRLVTDALWLEFPGRQIYR